MGHERDIVAISEIGLEVRSSVRAIWSQHEAAYRFYSAAW